MISHPALSVVNPLGNRTLISILFAAYDAEA